MMANGHESTLLVNRASSVATTHSISQPMWSS